MLHAIDRRSIYREAKLFGCFSAMVATFDKVSLLMPADSVIVSGIFVEMDATK